MKLIASADGRRRIWYGTFEIEQICSDRIVHAGVWPSEENCHVDVESLVEHDLNATVDYAADLPAELLGYTMFADPIRVVINRSLTEAATAAGASMASIGRWRATIAHEAAHILLHSTLYAPLDVGPGRPLIRPVQCYREAIESPIVRDWREVQANMGMAALLMPRIIFDREATGAFVRRGRAIPPLPRSAVEVDEVVAFLSQRFQVSRQSARIRLETTGYIV